MKLIWSGLLCGLVCVSAVNAQEAPVHKVTYEKDILPIFRQHCGSCHNPNDRKGGLAVDSFALLMQGGASGDAVIPGDADSSFLFLVVNRDSEPFMPPNGAKIPQEQIDLLKAWITAGAPLKSDSKVEIKENKALKNMTVDIGRPADAPTLPGPEFNQKPVHETTRPNTITGLAASPWAPLYAVSSYQQVLLFGAEPAKLLGVLPYPEGIPEQINFSRNGKLLAVGGGRGGASGNVVLFDVKTGERIAEIGAEYDSVLASDVTSDYRFVVLGGPKKMVRIFNAQTGEVLFEIKKHTDWVQAAEFSPDSVLCATGDRSNGLFLWETFTGKEFATLNGHKGAITDISWRPDSNAVASCSEDGDIKIWDVNTGEAIKSWKAHGSGTTSIQFTMEGNIVSAGRDKRVVLWDGNGKALKEIGGLPEIPTDVTYDNDRKLIMAGDMRGMIRMWNAEGKVVQEFQAIPKTPQVEAAAATAAN
ncbi:WD40 domain-containing protein [Lacunimicrobium album]